MENSGDSGKEEEEDKEQYAKEITEDYQIPEIKIKAQQLREKKKEVKLGKSEKEKEIASENELKNVEDADEEENKEESKTEEQTSNKELQGVIPQ